MCHQLLGILTITRVCTYINTQKVICKSHLNIEGIPSDYSLLTLFPHDHSFNLIRNFKELQYFIPIKLNIPDTSFLSSHSILCRVCSQIFSISIVNTLMSWLPPLSHFYILHLLKTQSWIPIMLQFLLRWFHSAHLIISCINFECQIFLTKSAPLNFMKHRQLSAQNLHSGQSSALYTQNVKA